MVRRCFVCKNIFEKGSERSFHTFPKDMLTRTRWFYILSIGRGQGISKYTYICSDHFETTDFLYKPAGRKHLKQGAIPKLGCTTTTSLPQNLSSETDPLAISNSDTNNVTVTQCAESLGEKPVLESSSGIANISQNVSLWDKPLLESSSSIADTESTLTASETEMLLQNVANSPDSNISLPPDIEIIYESQIQTPEEHVEDTNTPYISDMSDFRKSARKRYFGDIDSDDFCTLGEAKKSWSIARRTVLRQKKKIKNLQQTNRRFKARIKCLKSLLKFLKENNYMTDSAAKTKKVKVNQVAFRKRESPYSMFEVSDALQVIFNKCPKGEDTEIVDINDCLHRILAEDVYATDPHPPFTASIKDGYAVRYADGAGVRTVCDSVNAGEITNTTLDAGKIVRISTGAPTPIGADAVVQVEDTTLVKATADGSKELLVEIKVAPKLCQDMRPIGSDIPVNSLVMQTGDSISPGHVAVLATVGKTRLKVYKRASIGVFSTGNELQNPHEKLMPGHIRDCNRLALLSILKQYSYHADDCGIAKDNPDSVKEAFEKAFSEHDVVITTGGVSMGEFDLIKQVLVEDFEATIHFGRVNMKPGKPTTFATCHFNGQLKIIFGLPGNPVSALVTSVLFVIPTLRHFENCSETVFPQIPVELGVTQFLDARPEYVRVRLRNIKGSNILKAFPVGHQISSRINSFVGASALLCLPSIFEYNGKCEAGEVLQALLLEPLSIKS